VGETGGRGCCGVKGVLGEAEVFVFGSGGKGLTGGSNVDVLVVLPRTPGGSGERAKAKERLTCP